MEEKSFASAVKSIEDRTVTGIAAVFGNIDLRGWQSGTSARGAHFM